MFKKKIIVMQSNSMMKEIDINRQEAELSKKFGCKVILLLPTIDINFKIIK